MEQKKIKAEIAKMSFEEAVHKLEDIVTKMNSENILLEENINNYQYGALLKKHLESQLNNAKLKIEEIEQEK